MNTQQLRCFLSVADNLSYARAAQELYLTQPTVTHQINSLENELGVRLFYRTRHTVSLTQEGVMFYEDARAIYTKEQIAISKLRFQGSSTEPLLSFGFSSVIEMENFVPLLSRISERSSFHPYLRVIPGKSIWNLFLNTDLDCIFAYKGSYSEIPRIGITDIRTVHNVCLAPKPHPLAAMHRVSATDVAESRFIFCNPAVLPAATAALENELVSRIPPSHVYSCESVETVSALVQSGYGVAVLPENLCPVSGTLVQIPFDSQIRMTYSVFWKKEMPEAKKRILKIIEKTNKAGDNI